MKTMVRMNNIKNSLFLSALSVFALTSCVSEIADLNNIGKETGTMELNVDIAQPQTRAKTEVSNFPVTIYDADGKPVKDMSWETVSAVPAKITLPVGIYTVESHTPGEIQSKMTAPYYKGVKEAEVMKGINSGVEVICKMMNSPISVTYDDDFKDVFASWDITIDDGTANSTTAFKFTNTDSAPFYWYFGEEGVSELTLNFTGITKKDGSTVKATNTLKKDFKEGQHYDNDNPNFSGGDALELNFKPVDSTEGDIKSIIISASVKFTETNEPINVIVRDKDDLDPGVVKKPNELAFSKTTATGVIGQEFVSPTLNNPYNLPLTWSSSTPTVATVNQNGVVTLVAAGETTIMAIFAGDDEYEAGFVQYTLKVESQSGGDDKITLTIPDPVTLTDAEAATADPTTCDVVMHADYGIKSVMVKVKSSNPDMIEALNGVAELNPGVDLVNGCEVVGNQGLVDFLGGLDKVITVPTQGDTDYTFPVGQFYLFLGALSGEHNFEMTVTDMQGKTKSGVVRITIVATSE